MTQEDPQTEVDALNVEYKEYINNLWIRWRFENRPRSMNVYEVMSPDEHAEVQNKLKQWAIYITPFAEKWWGERGYEVFWPEDNKDPMRLRKLKDA